MQTTRVARDIYIYAADNVLNDNKQSMREIPILIAYFFCEVYLLNTTITCRKH